MKLSRTALRTELIADRRAIPTPIREQWDKEITAQVVEWCSKYLRQRRGGAESAPIVGVYCPIQAEPSLHEAFPKMIELGVQLALPAAPIPNHGLTFAVWKPGDELMKDNFGVRVPLKTAPIVSPDVLFIPCVGYTPNGYRLGYGGGFYDRTLAVSMKPKTVGIAYRQSQCELDVLPHDIALDLIITNY